jgi:LytS/YehU family sensor histidine kinase
MLIRLSELLRYMLYESETKEVSVEKELEYLQQLTDLQKLRFQEPKFIQLSIHNENSELRIAPLLLLPFVENAFKFVSRAHKVPAIKINIDVGDDHIHFHCENFFSVNSDDSIDNKTGGIGLTNVQRRLELLYPDKFNLSINKTDHKFTVDLHLSSV